MKPPIDCTCESSASKELPWGDLSSPLIYIIGRILLNERHVPNLLYHSFYSPFIPIICLTHYVWHYITVAEGACRTGSPSRYSSLQLSSASLWVLGLKIIYCSMESVQDSKWKEGHIVMGREQSLMRVQYLSDRTVSNSDASVFIARTWGSREAFWSRNLVLRVTWLDKSEQSGPFALIAAILTSQMATVCSCPH